MYTLVKRSALAAVACAQLLGSPECSYADTFTWIGANSNDITDAGNWSPGGGPPTFGDTALFTGFNPTNPTLGVNLFPPNFEADIIKFDSPTSYNIITNGLDMPLTYFTSLSGAGIINLNNSVSHTLSCIKGGVLIFGEGTAGDQSITYDIGSDDINNRSLLLFFGNSTAESANILGNPNGFILFGVNSSLGSATITLNNALMDINTSNTASTAHVSLANFSNCFFEQSITLDALTSDSTSLINFLGVLTVGDATNGNVIAGTMINTGNFVKQGTGNLTLSGLNSYGGGTTVNDGTLIVNTTSLPKSILQPSATVYNAGILNFDQPSAGTFDGDIFLNSTSATLLTSGNGIITFSGALTGTGKLSLINASYVILSNAANTYSGGTQVPAGSILEGFSPAIQGSILNDELVIFYQDTDSTFHGTFSSTVTTSTIAKHGLGTLAINQNNLNFHGTTHVYQGTLLLNSILGGNMILTAGTLRGNGTLLGNMTNGGTIEPGNSIGTFNIIGNYTQTSSGTYIAEINGSGQSDLINVGGTASLDGALVVTTLDGIVDPTKTYILLHADGGIDGFYTSIRSTSAILVPVITYGPLDVLLKVKPLFTAIATDHNQTAVALQLESIDNPTPQELAIITTLTMLGNSPATIEQARRALSQMSGEQYANALFTSETASRRFIRRLYDPLRSLLIYDPNCPENWQYRQRDCGNFYAFEPIGAAVCNNLTGWMTLGGGRTLLEHDHNAAGFKMNSFELALGAQRTFQRSLTVGVAGGYEYDQVHYNLSGSGTNHMALLGIYGLYRPSGYYLLADLAANWNFSKVNRHIVLGDLRFHAHSRPESVQGTLYIEGGLDLNCRCLLFQPFVALETTIFSAHRIHEKGATPLNLSIHSKKHSNTYSRLGLHLSTLMPRWSLAFDFAWQYRLTSLSNSLRENFTDFGSDFTIRGVNVPRNSLDAALNLSAQLCDGWELFAEVSGERWTHASTYSFIGGVKYTW